MSKWSIKYCQLLFPIVSGRGLPTHCGLIRASADVQIRTLLSRIRRICSLAQVHQVKAVPLLDAEFLGQLVCHIIDDTIKISFNCACNIMCDAAEERADSG
jgi:hypothetical protein